MRKEYTCSRCGKIILGVYPIRICVFHKKYEKYEAYKQKLKFDYCRECFKEIRKEMGKVK